jgi:hypothetical protein
LVGPGGSQRQGAGAAPWAPKSADVLRVRLPPNPQDLAERARRVRRAGRGTHQEQSQQGPRPGLTLVCYAVGWEMFTSQEVPNPSTHMPNSSPQTCFCMGIVVVPLADSFSK